jgi:hypothetical protein
MTDPTRVVDAGDLRLYRTEIPNLIDDMSLSVYAFRLYVHLKRVAGASNEGACWQSTRTLATHCGMSASKVSESKQELVDAGLIEIEPGDRTKSDTMTIVNVWPQNFAKYTKTTDDSGVRTANTPPSGCSHSEQGVRTANAGVRVVVHKKEPIKKEPVKKGERDSTPSQQPESAKPQSPPPQPLIAELTNDPYMDAAVNKFNRQQQGRAAHPGQIPMDDWNKQVPKNLRMPLVGTIADLTGKRPLWESDDVKTSNLLHEAAIKAHKWGYTPEDLRNLESLWISDWRSGGKLAGRIDQFMEFLSEKKAESAPPPTTLQPQRRTVARGGSYAWS